MTDLVAYVIAYACAVKFGHWAFTKGVWPWARHMVVTDNWPGTSASDAEFREWLWLAITAGTGGVLGFLIACALENFYFRVQDPQPLWPSGTQVVSMLLLTFIGVKLFAPVHGLIERAVHSRLLNRNPQLEAEGHTPVVTDWESAASVGVIVFLFLLADEGLNLVLENELETLSRQGGLGKSVYTLVLSGIWPGIITYYWAAALTKRSGDEAFNSTLGSTAAAWLLIQGGCLAVFSVTFAYVHWKNGVGGLVGGVWLLVQFILVILLTAFIAAIGAALTIGLAACAGMLAIRLTPRHRGWALLGAVIAANLVLAIPYLLVLFLFYDALDQAEVRPEFKLLGQEREAMIVITQTLCPPIFWIAALMLEPRFRTLLHGNESAA